MKANHWLAAVVLGFVGLGANAAPLTLFFRVDFLFGSVATLLATILLGARYGLLATAIAGSYTMHLWGHPYATLIFLGETLFVAVALRRRIDDLILAVALYWLTAGMLLVFVTYRVVMGMEMEATLLIMLKQGVNGILNAFFASLLWNVLPPGWLGAVPRGKLSLRQWLTLPIAGLVLLPCVLLTVLESRTEIQQVERLADERLKLSVRNTVHHLQYLYGRRIAAVTEVARFVEARGDAVAPAAPDVQERLRLVKELFPDFHNLYIADTSATAVAFYPERNARGELAIGQSFADRDYAQLVRGSQKPVVSEVLMGRTGIFLPIQTVNVPIWRDGVYAGYASGALDLSGVELFLTRETAQSDLELTLIDRKGNVIASTVETVHPLSPGPIDLNRLLPTGLQSLWRWPPEKSVPQMLRFQRSWFLAHSEVGDGLGWTVIAQAPVAPYQLRLYAAYIDNLAIALAVTCAAFAAARWVISRLSRPVAQLAESTRDLPRKLTAGVAITWPPSAILEVETLTQNLRTMSSALQATFSEVRGNAGRLAAANAELEKEIASRREKEAVLRRSEGFLREQNRVLLELARNRDVGTPTLEESFRRITEAAAQVLAVERASIWFFDEAGTKIVCRDLYEASRGQHSGGGELHASACPRYFAALHREGVIAANEARLDPRTREFGEPYLDAARITAMLDAPLWIRGKMVGVICHEHVGTSRRWTTEEEVFAGAIADVVALAVEERERADAQAALAESEQRYRRIVDTAHEGIWLVDRDFNTTYVNGRMGELLGYTASEMNGRNARDFVFPEDKSVFEEHIERRRGGQPGSYDFRYRRKDGGEVWVISSAVPIHNAQGEFSGSLGMFTDVTLRRNVERERLLLLERERENRAEVERSRAALLEAQEKLQRYADELEQRVEERTRRLRDAVAEMESFSYTVSHDLRAPLRALMGYANVLEGEYGPKLDEKARHYLNRISSGAHRLDQLIQDVLSYSRIARSELTNERVDLDELAQGVVSEYPDLEKSKVNLRIDRPLLAVVGNVAFLTQCLSNLLGNAVKFSRQRERPEVRVYTERRGPNVRIWVEDNGIGIDPAYHTKIFGIFERVADSRIYEGTGIGLAIVHKAVERMGGTVGLESRLGEGSRFWIELAAADE